MIDYKKLRQALDEINKIACNAYKAKYFGDLQISDVQSLLCEVLDIAENSGECSIHWISAKERLPEEAGNYIIRLANGTVKMAEFRKGKYNRYFHNGKTATHWMPLPEPPEVNKNE